MLLELFTELQVIIEALNTWLDFIFDRNPRSIHTDISKLIQLRYTNKYGFSFCCSFISGQLLFVCYIVGIFNLPTRGLFLPDLLIRSFTRWRSVLNSYFWYVIFRSWSYRSVSSSSSLGTVDYIFETSQYVPVIDFLRFLDQLFLVQVINIQRFASLGQRSPFGIAGRITTTLTPIGTGCSRVTVFSNLSSPFGISAKMHWHWGQLLLAFCLFFFELSFDLALFFQTFYLE